MSARCSSRGRAPTRRLARERAVIERPEAGDCIRPPAYDQGVVEPSSKPSWRPAAAMKGNGRGEDDQGGFKPEPKPTRRGERVIKRPPRGKTYPGRVLHTLVIIVPPNNEQTNTRATTNLNQRTNLHEKERFFFNVSARFTSENLSTEMDFFPKLKIARARWIRGTVRGPGGSARPVRTHRTVGRGVRTRRWVRVGPDKE